MTIEIVTALIHAGGTVLAATIGSVSVLLVAVHRKWVVHLARTVEAYHAMETEWVKQDILASGNEATEGRITNRRGVLRRELLGDERPEFVSANQARKVRARYFNFD